MEHDSQPEAYCVHVWIRGIHPMLWQRFLVRSDSTLADLHAQVDVALSPEEKAEREEATVWVSGLDRINQGCGVKFCVDLSATPFYLFGSGYIEGSPLPWLVCDFGLVDAIESGIVKIPRIPVSDTTGRPDPKYFALWKHITNNLQPGEKLPGGKPKPEVIWRTPNGLYGRSRNGNAY